MTLTQTDYVALLKDIDPQARLRFFQRMLKGDPSQKLPNSDQPVPGVEEQYMAQLLEFQTYESQVGARNDAVCAMPEGEARERAREELSLMLEALARRRENLDVVAEALEKLQAAVKEILAAGTRL